MAARAICILAVMATLAGCARISESRLNPLNWFGRSEDAATTVTAPAAAVQANLIGQVVALRAEKTPGGAIIRATGLPPRQGYYDGALVEIDDDDARTLNYEFEISDPLSLTDVGPERSREVIVGIFVSDQSLEGVSRIQVNGSRNALTIRR